MKKMKLFAVVSFCVLFFLGCQKAEEQKLENAAVTYESLEKEYGIHFSTLENDGINTISMSLDELKICLESLANPDGQKFKADVIKDLSLARGEASYLGQLVRIEEGDINLGRLVKIRLDYYQSGKYFYTYIYDQSTGATLYTSLKNYNVFSNMYGNVIYRTFVDNNCAIEVVVNGKVTTLKFKLQVDWNLDTDYAEYTLTIGRN